MAPLRTLRDGRCRRHRDSFVDPALCRCHVSLHMAVRARWGSLPATLPLASTPISNELSTRTTRWRLVAASSAGAAARDVGESIRRACWPGARGLGEQGLDISSDHADMPRHRRRRSPARWAWPLFRTPAQSSRSLTPERPTPEDLGAEVDRHRPWHNDLRRRQAKIEAA